AEYYFLICRHQTSKPRNDRRDGLVLAINIDASSRNVHASVDPIQPGPKMPDNVPNRVGIRAALAKLDPRLRPTFLDSSSHAVPGHSPVVTLNNSEICQVSSYRTTTVPLIPYLLIRPSK